LSTRRLGDAVLERVVHTPMPLRDDAGNLARHFNAAALATRPFQVAPDPKKRTKLLQPAT
jgi:hypothetical protein